MGEEGPGTRLVRTTSIQEIMIDPKVYPEVPLRRLPLFLKGAVKFDTF